MTFSPERYVAALELAAEKHATQRMPGSDMPYLVHVVSVAAEVIASFTAATAPQGLDEDLAVVCALLHDTVEDTETTRAEIEARFGKAVGAGVSALSKDPELPKGEQMADSLRRIREQPREVWMVKLADRITNLAEPPHYWSRDKRMSYRDEAIVIADALGSASPALEARIRQRIVDYARFFST